MTLALDHDVLISTAATPNGTEVPLTDEQRKIPVFFKYVSTNPNLSDIQPEAPWREQVGVDEPVGARKRPRLAIAEGGEPRSVNEMDGLIIDLEGTPDGIYGYIDGIFRDEDETDQWEANTGQEAARAVRWAFRVTRILRTDGPARRDSALKTEEARREGEKADMFAAIAEAFKQGMAQAHAVGEHAPSAQAALNKGRK